MKLSSLLEALDIGSDVAESDIGLQQHFISTSAFDQVVRDETDLVLGPKGSGKTAMFRILADDQYPIPSLEDADVVPAFNTEGDVLFQNLRSHVGTIDESDLRTLWTSYILSLAGWYLVSAYQAVPEATKLRDALLANGLQEVVARPTSVWSWVVAMFKRLRRASAIEGRLDLGAGLPAVAGKAEFADEADTGFAQLDTDGLMARFVALLDKVDRRCWVIFDRLDEAFEDDSELERIALRSLMRAHSNLASYSPRFRTKLFLRKDILDRVTSEKGFVNITHLRSLEITWTRHHILDMLMKRLVARDEVLRFLHAREVTTPKGALNALISSVDESPRSRRGVEKGKRRITDPLTYILDKSSDASGEYNPRNVVYMISRAKSLELAACELSNPNLFKPRRPVISQESLVRAWRQLSEKRLVDTLYAEHNSLRPAIEAFQNGPQSFNRDYVVSRVEGLDSDAKGVNACIRELQYAGFLRLTGVDTYRVPDLWRPGLNLVPLPPGHKPRSS